MKRRRPPYLRVVGEPVAPGVLTWADIATAPYVDCGRYVIDAVVATIVDGAADYGLQFNDETKLREEVGDVIARYIREWIVEQITEMRETRDEVLGSGAGQEASVYLLSDHRHE